MRVGFIGAGNITNIVMDVIEKEGLGCEITSVFDADPARAQEFRGRFGGSIRVCDDIDSLLDDVDIIVEAASILAVKEYGVRVLEAKKELVVMSVGALCDELLLDEMRLSAKKNNVRVYIPSGGVGGVDGLKAACLNGLDSVLLITTKSPESLGSVVKEKKVLFEGPVFEGIKKFPRNVNVAATLGLVAGFDKLILRVVVDPDVRDNMHEIVVCGDFGEMRVKNINRPSPNNPQTSYIAALSVVAVLKRILDDVEFGT